MNAAQLEVILRSLEVQVKQLEKQFEDARRLAERLQEQNRTLQSQLDKTQQKLDDHIAHTEKWDNRRWGIIGLFVAAVISLAANLVLTVARK